MTFTHSCYVKVEDPQKRKEVASILVNMGYDIYFSLRNVYGKMIYTIRDGAYSGDYASENCINCGTNLDYFLAVAAINDQNDYMQWFVFNSKCPNVHTCWWLCDKQSFIEYSRCQGLRNSHILSHKATPTELAEYFNRKEIEG